MNNNDEISNLPLVMIGSFGHAGIDWIHSLLDNHKEILIMPPFSFFRTMEKIKRKGINLEKLSNKQISDIFSNTFSNDISYQIKSRKFLFNKDHEKKFNYYFLEFLNNSKQKILEKKIFYGIHYSFSKVHNIKLKDKKIIVTQEHVPWHCIKYEKLFNSKFLIIFRDPRAVLGGGILKMKNSNSDKMINSFQFDTMILSMISSFNYYLKNQKNKKIYTITNELMHKNLKKQMLKIAEWLNVEYSNTMLEQTFMGAKWKGESAYLEKNNELNQTPNDFYNPEAVEKRWRSVLSKKEILIVETVFRKMMNIFLYQKDNKLDILELIKGYYYFYFIHQHQQKFFINKYLIILRNLIRRSFILFFGSKSINFFKFK